MRVGFVSSEISPYASTGGLADVCGSLPRALVAAGAEAVQFMPMYRKVLEGDYAVEDTGIRLSIPVGFHRYRADIWKTRNSTPSVYFIRRDEFFDRAQLYNLSDRDYDDNFERFVFFQKAVVALIDQLDLNLDIVHAHDWQTGLMPLYLRHGQSGEGRRSREKTVFTIHNLAFQGIFDGELYSYTNLPFSCFNVDMMEYYGNINMLKSGINGADFITTVSQTYAREIQTEDWGCGLQGVLANVRPRLCGIVNGIDTAVWNPAADKMIAARFDRDHLDGKDTCKADLIKRLKLTIKPRDPLLGMVTRLTSQKGIELIDASLDGIMSRSNAGLALLGSGSDAMLAMVNRWAKKWPGRVGIKTGFDVKLSHRIEAGADIYLMPSKFEPCGLNQLYSLRYGTIPVVHAVGGLDDTIVDVGEQPQTGYGFKFSAFTAEAFQQRTLDAIDAYKNAKRWNDIVRRAMDQDFSWLTSARRYLKLYEQIRAAPSTMP